MLRTTIGVLLLWKQLPRAYLNEYWYSLPIHVSIARRYLARCPSIGKMFINQIPQKCSTRSQLQMLLTVVTSGVYLLDASHILQTKEGKRSVQLSSHPPTLPKYQSPSFWHCQIGSITPRPAPHPNLICVPKLSPRSNT